MKVMTILGSPRVHGNTAKVLGLFEDLVGKEHELVRVNVASSDVNGCLGCMACQEAVDGPGCVQRDDATQIFERMMDVEAVVYAAPLYCWSFPSQMKALIDRHFCLVTGRGTSDYRSLLKDKRVALLITCGGPVEGNADIIQALFDRMSYYAQWHVVGKYIVPGCTTPDAMDSKAVETAKKMAQDVAGI